MKRIDFINDWRFFKEGSGERIIDLPHDAMIEEKRNQGSPSSSAGAYFPGGLYTYEKSFNVPREWEDMKAVFQFEGVYRNAKVYINGKEAGGRSYGYVPFFADTDNLLNYGENNTIRVVADNSMLPDSRWYTGSGIYRPVWLWLGSRQHINIEGVKISTLSYSPAKIKIETSHTGGEINAEVSRDGKLAASGSGSSIILDIPDAKLWSDENPNLYECRVTLSVNGKVTDEVTESFGIRLVEWNRNGLFINGKETLLRGGCVHHDNGILGARSYAQSEDRRVRILKNSGYNAIRSSHNPAAASLLSACDKYGMYVMDETWDMWYSHKSKYDYASEFLNNYKQDIESIVSRDFNHPSVIMYSLGNEISEPHEAKGVALMKEMTEYIHSLDGNRAVTCGINLWLITRASKGKGVYKEGGGLSMDKKSSGKKISSTLFNFVTSMVGTGINKGANSIYADKVTSPCIDVLDIAGYNYASGRYPLEAKAHPDRIIIGTETFPQDIAKNWKMVKKYPYLIGDFMWTSWDYLGEVGIGAWAYTDDGGAFMKPYPWLLAGTGAVDILGVPGAEAEYAAVVWGLRNKPYIGVRPVNHPGVKPAKAVWRGTDAVDSWSWKDCEGNNAFVEIYSDADSIELILNSKTLGRKKVRDFKAIFKTKYYSGTLTAVAFDSNGRELSRSALISADSRTGISVKPEKSSVKPGEIVYADICIADANGIIESNNDTKLNVTVKDGELLAFGSANPRTEESYLSGNFTTYYGRAQAVVRSKNPCLMTICVKSGNSEPVCASITVEP